MFRRKGSPYWQFDFEIQGYRFSGSTKLTDQHHAAAFEESEKAKAREFVEHAIATDSQPLTIERACARWWNEHGKNLRDPALKSKLDWLVAAIGPKTQLHQITNDMVSRLVQLRRQDVRTDSTETIEGRRRQLYRPITANTVNKTTISLLRRVMRRAIENWDAAIPKQPTWKKHLLPEIRRGVREISPAEDLRLDQIEPAEYALLRRFAEITGLRRRNLILTWSQVDFDAGVIRVVSKGGVPRVLPLTREAYAILWLQRGQHPQFVFTYIAQRTYKIPKGGSGGLRVKGHRYPITYTGLGSNHRNWKKAGVDARIHDMRHTTGMRVLRKTGNLKAVQKILGHADIAITSRFYTDATIEDQRQAMEQGSEQAAAQTPLLIEHKKDGET